MRAIPLRFLAATLVALAPLAAWAQPALPEGLPSQGSLSQGDESAIAAWAEGQWALLGQADPVAARRARRALVEPLLAEDTSPAFRSAVDGVLAEELESALGGDRPFLAINAALLSGWLATDRSVRSLVRAAETGGVAVRYAAVAGVGNAMQAATSSAPAFNEQTGRDAVASLADRLEVTLDRSMLEVHVDALIDAMGVPASRFAGFSDFTAERLTRALGTRLNTLPVDGHLADRVGPLVRAMGELRLQVTQRRREVGEGWRNASLRLLGQAAALGFRYVRAEASGTAPAEGERHRGAVETCLTVASSIPPLLGLDSTTERALAEVDLLGGFAGGDSDRYQRAVGDLLSVLESRFGLRGDAFNLG